MNIYYSTAPQDTEVFIRRVLSLEWEGDAVLARTSEGKPYLTAAGAPNLSATHTAGLIAVAVGKVEVGIDAERVSARRHAAITARLTPAERCEDFFTLWTAKESYVKLCGSTLAKLYRRMEYAAGKLYVDGREARAVFLHFTVEGCRLCLCTREPADARLIPL